MKKVFATSGAAFLLLAGIALAQAPDALYPMMGAPMMQDGDWGYQNYDKDVYYRGSDVSVRRHMMGDGGFGGSVMWLGGIFLVVIWALIIFALIAAVKWIFNQVSGSVSALEALKKRYAEGEITRKEFEEIKKDLTS